MPPWCRPTGIRVWGSIDAGARRTLLNYGMYDVQPVNPDEWSSPPWEARIVPLPPFKQAIVGRGTVNTKGALRAFVNAYNAHDQGTRQTASEPPVRD